MLHGLAAVPDALMLAVLDRLLPGGDGWPAAGGLGLAATVKAQAAATPAQAEDGRAALLALPADFPARAAPVQDAALRAVEAAQPAPFAALVAAAYSAYYTDARVQAVIERKTGTPVRPPQPLGHALPPFDESLLAQVRARGPIWRAA